MYISLGLLICDEILNCTWLCKLEALTMDSLLTGGHNVTQTSLLIPDGGYLYWSQYYAFFSSYII